MKIPSSKELNEAKVVDEILENLSPEYCFELFQKSIDKCPVTITKRLLQSDDLYTKVHYEHGEPYSLLVRRRLMDGIQQYLKFTATIGKKTIIKKADDIVS